MFGWRIRKAIHKYPTDNGISMAVIHKKMARICKRWKFWNSDIRKAYGNHVGYVIVPWIIREENIIISEDPSVTKYYEKKIDASKYSTIKISGYK